MKTFSYLATPYSKWETGIEDAFKEASRLAARLLLRGISVYSPIAHTHSIAIYGQLDPLDHSIWLPFDEAMMEAAERLIVAQLKGWRESRGIAHEIDFFRQRGKPVQYVDPVSLLFNNKPAEESR